MSIETIAGLATERQEAVNDTAAMLRAAILPPDSGDDFDRLVSVPVTCRRPKALEYFRVRPGPEWMASVLLFREKRDGIGGDYFAVNPSIAHHLGGQARPFDLRLAINRAGALLLVPIPRGDGTRDTLRSSLLAAIAEAERGWCRIEWDGPSGGWRLFRAEGDLGEPTWPDTAIPDIGAAIETALSGHFVSDEEHPAVRRARGLE